jgi:uncharacterized protein YbjQ (UPF0145 family)
MNIVRQVGSLAFVLGLFTAVFAGIPWYVMVADDPVVPWWLRIAVFCLLGGILVVLGTVAVEQRAVRAPREAPPAMPARPVLLLNSDALPSREVTEVLGLVAGHTVYAIWLGNDLSAVVRLILGGELTEYTDMMARARESATGRMVAQAARMGADAIINVRYMTTSVIGSAAELLVYGTAVKVGPPVTPAKDAGGAPA